MAEVNTGGDNGGGGKAKPKKMDLRVDFTPMVDMNMLLITFFMFCTSLSKPQTMDIVMPTKDNQEIADDQKNLVKESNAITVLLGEDNVVYYYTGMPKYDDYSSLKQTDYSPEGLRDVLLKRNAKAVAKMQELRIKRSTKKMSEDEFRKQSAEVRNEKDGQVVVIKPTDGATYRNLVDALDEMQICSIGKYAIVDVADGDKFLIENYQKKGALSAEAAKK